MIAENAVCILGVSPNFEITVARGLKFHWYLRTLSIKFQKARTKIEVSLSLPCWLSHSLAVRKTSILLLDFFTSLFGNNKDEF